LPCYRPLPTAAVRSGRRLAASAAVRQPILAVWRSPTTNAIGARSATSTSSSTTKGLSPKSPFPGAWGSPRPSVAVRPRSAVQRWFDQYLRGVQEPWPGAWRIPGETPFFHRVYRAVHRIPVGQTRSYGEIARQCGSPGAARAVGSAMARNPLPLLVPCHRVLAAGSRIGGFGCGVAMKRELLVREADAAGRPYPIQETTPPSQRPATNSA